MEVSTSCSVVTCTSTSRPPTFMERQSLFSEAVEVVPSQTSSAQVMEVTETKTWVHWEESKNDSPDARSFCRTCMDYLGEPRRGFTNFEDVPQVVEMIEACTTIKICCNDGLPEQVCNTCITSLAMAYEFRQRCERADKDVRLFFKMASLASDQIKQESVDFIDIKIEKPDFLDYANDSQDFDDKSLISEKYDLSDDTKICKNSHELNSESHEYATVDIKEKEDFENQTKNKEPDFETNTSNLIQNSKEKNLSIYTLSPVNCDICNKTCRSIYYLNQHKLVHSENRPFDCEICKKAFKQQPTLRRHMLTHLEKQHQCDVCKKFFIEKSTLRRHIITIHADFNPESQVIKKNHKQRYSCFKCGKVFKSQAKYNVHQDMHGNPNCECEICGKVYASRSHLKIHQRIHTGEKPYVCSMCNMKFAFKHVLKSHQARIHQKVRKFKCNLCSLSFNEKSDLISHASCHMSNLKENKLHYDSHKNLVKFIKVKHKLQITKSNRKNDDNTTPGPIQGLFGQRIDLIPERNKSLNDDDNMDDIDKSDSVDGKDGICKSPKSLMDQGKNDKVCMNL